MYSITSDSPWALLIFQTRTSPAFFPIIFHTKHSKGILSFFFISSFYITFLSSSTWTSQESAPFLPPPSACEMRSSLDHQNNKESNERSLLQIERRKQLPTKCQQAVNKQKKRGNQNNQQANNQITSEHTPAISHTHSFFCFVSVMYLLASGWGSSSHSTVCPRKTKHRKKEKRDKKEKRLNGRKGKKETTNPNDDDDDDDEEDSHHLFFSVR